MTVGGTCVLSAPRPELPHVTECLAYDD